MLQFWGQKKLLVIIDDKAKIPTNITTAKKQTPLVMHIEYQVSMLDYDFFFGSKHKLIRSVISDMKDLTNDAVSYSGPTYISVRSAVNSGSLAFYYLCAKNRVHSLPEFTESFEVKSSKEKKVMVVTVENPYEIYQHYHLCN